MDPGVTMAPLGPRSRVLPELSPSGSTPYFDGQSRPPPIVPRRTQHHNRQSTEFQEYHRRPSESAEFPGRTGDRDPHNQPQAMPVNGHTTAIYSGRGGRTHSVSELTSLQQREEVHLLRIRVEDQGVEVNKKERELQYSHDQIKQLTTMLTEKKEELLKSEDRVVSLQADLSESRETVLDLQRGQRTQSIRSSVSEPELALGREVEHLRDLLEEESRQKDYYSMQLKMERGQWKHKILEHEEEVRRYQEQETDVRTHAQHRQPEQQQHRQQEQQQYRQPLNYQPAHVDGDIKARMEMLEAQVAIYKEDFQTEREDRTRAQNTITTLKEEMTTLQKTNELLVNERALPQPHPRQR